MNHMTTATSISRVCEAIYDLHATLRKFVRNTETPPEATARVRRMILDLQAECLAILDGEMKP